MRQAFANLKTWRGKGGVRPWLYLPFVFFCYAILDVLLRFSYREFLFLRFLYSPANLLTIGWCLILTAIACALPGRWRKGFLLLSVPLFMLLTLTHSVLRNLFDRFFMFSVLAFAGDGLAFADRQYIQVAPLVMLALLLCLLSLLAALLLAPGKGEGSARRPLLAALLAFLLGVGIISFSHKTWLTTEDASLSWDNYANPAVVYENFTDSTTTLLLTGLYQYTARDLILTLSPGGSEISAEDRAALEAYAAERKAERQDNARTGSLAGKNLILVQLEAIDSWMLCQEYMPNLWALKQESLVFANHYSPGYITAGTFNTEFLANTGLLPATGHTSTNVYYRNHYPFSLANQFRAAGYSAESFHGSEGNIYNRGSFHPAIGYEAYHGGKDMGMPDYTMDRDMLTAYEGIVREEPFLSFLITYSAHGPYYSTMSPFLAHEGEARQVACMDEGNYMYAVAGAIETDLMIGELLTRMEADGSLDDTVLVFYTDHYNYYMMDDELCMRIKGVDEANLLRHTDFFIYAKGQEPETVQTVTSSLDILPTLANLFGLPDGDALYLGHDAFSGAGGWVFFPDNSWLDGETYWDYRSPVTELSAQRAQEIAETMRMGSLLLQSDYFAGRP